MRLAEVFGREDKPGVIPREVTMSGFGGIHPKDYMNLRAQGKTAADLEPLQLRLSQAKNFLRTTKRDISGQLRAHRLRTDPERHAKQFRNAEAAQWLKDIGTKGAVLTGAQNKSQKVSDDLLAKFAQWKDNQKQFRKRNALVLGGAILGTAVGLKGIQTFRKWRKKAKEKTQYRGYDVYPEHEYAAIGQQPYNQPYYNEEIIEHIREFKRSQYLF